MRFRTGWLLLVVVDLSSCASVQKVASTEPGGASGKQKTGLLHLKVDIAPPSSKANPDPIPGTAKQGWWHWVVPGNWDFYRSDLTWEDGTSTYPKDGAGIAGSGGPAARTSPNEGLTP